MFDTVVGFSSGVGRLLQLTAVVEPDGMSHRVEERIEMVLYIRTATRCC